MASAQEIAHEDAVLKMAALQKRYAEEAAKRYRPDGAAQFVELSDAEERFRALAEDPWADHEALNALEPVRLDATYKYLIAGAGYGGILFAVRLIEAGAATADDIRFIEQGGGFGGTWYWNRYPGLHCDVESYVYMPLLEELEHIPARKYVTGLELREHAERMVAHWDLADKALFRTTVSSITWNDQTQGWTVKATEGRGPSEEAVERTLYGQYVMIAPGILAKPQIPRIPGLVNFKGDYIHTARWDFMVSGGSEEKQNLTGLKGKRVGIVGTGATAVQLIPVLAKFAEELFVFQRTPSVVDWRGQKSTDTDLFRAAVASKPGWQAARRANLARFMSNAPLPNEENLVADAWSQLPSVSALSGSPNYGIIEPTPEKIGEHIGRMLALDMPHAERIRARVDDIVQDPSIAAKLKAWYPTWCKRTAFSDTYLQAFNQPNVHLVDTDGKGVSSATERGLVVGDEEYPLDIIILATGYRSPVVGQGNPARRAGVEVFGRDSQSLDEKWQDKGAATLHGVATHGFPNLFFMGFTHAATTPSFTTTMDISAAHVAYILAEAQSKVGNQKRAIIEATTEAEDAYVDEIMRQAAFTSTISVCTPGYLSAEGDVLKGQDDPVKMMKAARSSIWTLGIDSWMGMLEAWRNEGSLQGFTVDPVNAA